MQVLREDIPMAHGTVEPVCLTPLDGQVVCEDPVLVDECASDPDSDTSGDDPGDSATEPFPEASKVEELEVMELDPPRKEVFHRDLAAKHLSMEVSWLKHALISRMVNKLSLIHI